MKKLVALGMALTMVMSILTGCGGSASSSAASSSDASSDSSASSDFNVPAGAKVVKFGNSGAIGEPAPETCQYFCDLVNEKIGARYYPYFHPAPPPCTSWATRPPCWRTSRWACRRAL